MNSSNDKQAAAANNKLENSQSAGAKSVQAPNSGVDGKPAGKLKEHLSLASTALPIAGAIGTLGVWLAATFYVGDVQIATDRPFNSLEVRVSDKKGQESVFHTPHFQLMPGNYHLEVTVDSQYKQHAEVKSVFGKSTNIAIHNPLSTAPAAVDSGNASSESKPYRGIAAQIMGEDPDLKSANQQSSSEHAGNADSQNADQEQSASVKKRWWQFWKKTPTE